MPDLRFQSQPPGQTEIPRAQARRGPVGARLHRAAEQERAVQEGRRPAQRPGPDPAHLLQARLRLDRPGRPARPVPLDGPLHPARARLRRRQDRDARGGGARRRVTSCCASAPTAGCCPPTTVRALGTDRRRLRARHGDVADRGDVRFHWILIMEDVPVDVGTADDSGLSSVEGTVTTAGPRLGSRGMARTVGRRSEALEEISHRCIGDRLRLSDLPRNSDRHHSHPSHDVSPGRRRCRSSAPCTPTSDRFWTCR